MSTYKVPDKSHLPDWLQDGPKICRVDEGRTRTIVWYEEDQWYIDDAGHYWCQAEPITEPEPVRCDKGHEPVVRKVNHDEWHVLCLDDEWVHHRTVGYHPDRDTAIRMWNAAMGAVEEASDGV